MYILHYTHIDTNCGYSPVRYAPETVQTQESKRYQTPRDSTQDVQNQGSFE